MVETKAENVENPSASTESEELKEKLIEEVSATATEMDIVEDSAVSGESVENKVKSAEDVTAAEDIGEDFAVSDKCDENVVTQVEDVTTTVEMVIVEDPAVSSNSEEINTKTIIEDVTATGADNIKGPNTDTETNKEAIA